MENINGAPKARGFEWWMLNGVFAGAAFSAFMTILIPRYVTAVTENPANAGIVMAVISLAAILGPILGRFADKYHAHRLIMNLGMLGMSVGFAVYAGSAESGALAVLDAIILGLALAAVNTLGITFIVGARLSQAVEGKQMTVWNLVMPIGQVIGGVIIGAAMNAELTHSQLFWVAAGVLFIGFLISVATTKKPTQRLYAAVDLKGEDKAAEITQARRNTLRTVLISSFGLFLVIMIFNSICSNGINSQIANIMPQVYGFSDTQTATLISVAGLLNIAFTLLGGAWMMRKGAFPVFAGGTIMRMAGATGMAVVGLITGSPLLLAAFMMQVLYQGIPLARLAQASLGVRFATIPVGEASGFIIGASAAGSFIGALIAGYLAGNIGYNAVNWMGVIAGGVSVLLLLVWVRPLWRRKQADAIT